MTVEDLERAIERVYYAYEIEFEGYDRRTFVDFVARALKLNRTGDQKGLATFYERQLLRIRANIGRVRVIK